MTLFVLRFRIFVTRIAHLCLTAYAPTQLLLPRLSRVLRRLKPIAFSTPPSTPALFAEKRKSLPPRVCTHTCHALASVLRRLKPRAFSTPPSNFTPGYNEHSTWTNDFAPWPVAFPTPPKSPLLARPKLNHHLRFSTMREADQSLIHSLVLLKTQSSLQPVPSHTIPATPRLTLALAAAHSS